MIDVVTIQGVGETVGQKPPRMAEHVMTHLDPARFREVPVTDYVTVGPVGVDPGPSLQASVDRVVAAAADTIDRTPNPAVLLGYSGGAMVAHRLADQISRGQHPRLDVRGVALVADPLMPRGQSAVGYGVAGDEPIHGMPAYWAWNPWDPICCAGDPSPLHTLSDQVMAMNLGAPDVWADDLIDRLKRGRWQPSAIDWRHPIATLQRYSRAIRQLQFYTEGGHFAAYRGGPAKETAAWIQGLV